MKTWFIYCPEERKVHKFSSQEDMEFCASGIIQDVYLDGDSGWSDQLWHTICGYGDLPVKITDYDEWEDRLEAMKTHEIVEDVIDKRDNYCHGKDFDENAEGETWSYGSDFEFIATYGIRKAEEE